MRGRGLKLDGTEEEPPETLSLPVRERGLKRGQRSLVGHTSRPVRARGFKQHIVDNGAGNAVVASRVGVWI